MNQPSLYFDRRVPDELLAALEPGGRFHDFVEAIRRHPTEPLDLQLRCRDGTAPHATLYLGLTKIVQLCLNSKGDFWLRGQAGTQTFDKASSPWRQHWKAWATPQTLDSLDAISRTERGAYIDAIVDFAHEGRYVSREGGLQARLARVEDRFVVIDREAVVGFRHGAKDDHLAAARDRVADATDLLRADPGEPWTYTRAVRGHQWEGSKDEGRKAHDFGDELDALAVDRNGRVLVIEAKHGGDTGGIAWTPAQVAVYLRLFMAWVDAVGDDASAETLESMLTQRRRLDLAGDDLPHVSRPLQLVPVIAIGIGSVKNAAEANRRMRLVRMALATADEPLTGLEVLQLGEDGQLCDVGLGGLV